VAEYARTYELRWSDVDANGHVRHSVYSELGADARIAWLADGGFPWKRLEEIGLGPVLLREELEYRREIGIGERVRIDVRASGLSPDGARWKLRHDLFKEDGSLAGSVTVLGGWLDLSARRLVVPPEPLAELLRATAQAPEFEELAPLRR
jgi:acyl-CoA thioester hydrolase